MLSTSSRVQCPQNDVGSVLCVATQFVPSSCELGHEEDALLARGPGPAEAGSAHRSALGPCVHPENGERLGKRDPGIPGTLIPNANHTGGLRPGGGAAFVSVSQLSPVGCLGNSHSPSQQEHARALPHGGWQGHPWGRTGLPCGHRWARAGKSGLMFTVGLLHVTPLRRVHALPQ